MAPSDLGRWEFNHLDQDGKTEKIQYNLIRGHDISAGHQADRTAWEKYKHLAPDGFMPQFLKTALELWELFWLDQDGGATAIQRALNNREDLFSPQPECSEKGFRDACEKYKHFAPSDYKSFFQKTDLEIWETRASGGTWQIQRNLKKNGYNIFRTCRRCRGV